MPACSTMLLRYYSRSALQREPAVDAPVEGGRQELAVAVARRRWSSRCWPPAALMRRPYWFCSPNCRPRSTKPCAVPWSSKPVPIEVTGVAPARLVTKLIDAGRRGEAVVERGGALEHLDALLVLHRDLGHVGDRERAVEPEVGAVLDRDAADHQLVEGVAAVLLARDAGRVAQHVVDAGGALQFDDLARHRVDGGRHVHDAGAAEAAGFDGVGDEAVAALGLDGHARRARRRPRGWKGWPARRRAGPPTRAASQRRTCAWDRRAGGPGPGDGVRIEEKVAGL